MIDTVPGTDEHKAKWGGFNDFPPNWRELTEEEFAESHFFVYEFKTREYRQMHDPGRTKPATRATLYFMHDGTGYALVSDRSKRKLHYFKFGCAHTYRGLGFEECRARGIYHWGRCYHVSECTTCGHIHAVDSSD